jgi:hypothetical protein
MRLARTTILAGGAALLVAGTAAYAAEKLHTLNVALPDGSVAQIEYSGDVAPSVAVQPVDAIPVVFTDPFAELDQMAAYMEAQHQAMMQQVAALEKAAAEGNTGAPGQLTTVSNLPAGVHYSYVSSATDANGCTQTVEYSSDGSSPQPKVTRTSAGSCDKATSDAPIAASTPRQPEAEGPGTKV